jgi:hypothetical protein
MTMIRELHRPWAVALATCAVAAAQENVFEEVALRVSSLRPNGACIVDRGNRDQVQAGDRVIFAPRNGPVVQGRVAEVDERTALVELADPAAVVPIGTRGHVLVPKARRAAAQPAPAQQPTQPSPTATDPSAPPAEEEWRPGMPLLGTTRPPRPVERPATMRGRFYGGANVVRTLGSWSQSYLDTGVDVELDNLRGDGGTLRVHGEFNWSKETSENTGADLRLFELSYERGGTRFQPWRWQVGRFLQRDMPEFGVLDGIEVGYRREGSARFGASFGYLPELDEDMESFADLQLAAWYVWNQDIAERVQVGVGYQKSWHRFELDRDLVLVKARYLPVEGWDLSSTLWIDFYTSGDDLKDETVEVSRANVFASRRWAKRGGVEAFFDHEEYPETRRRELPQTIQPLTLIDAHQDRVSLHAWVDTESGTRWFTRLTGWIDEAREGGAVELGVQIEGLLQPRTRTTLALFDVQGLTNTVFGARIEHGGTHDWGRLDLLYELGFVHHEGFPADSDDLLQHRVGALATTGVGAGWDATFFADGTLWDDELSLGIGIYLQKLF